MPTSNYSAFHPCLERVSATSRTAVYGPVRTVVWEGRSREAPPYPDFRWISDATASEDTVELSPHGSHTRMLVTHRRLADRRQLLGASAGWHVHIGILMDLLSEH